MGNVSAAIADNKALLGDGSSSYTSSFGALAARVRLTSSLAFKKLPTPARSICADTAAVLSELQPASKALISSGRRRSLLVGINYYDTQDELHGCVNDVLRMVPVLAGVGFPCDSENQRVLTDSVSSNAKQRPTRANILEAIAWLVEGAQRGDALFFHYSGHGGRSGCRRGQFRKTLVPADFESAGLIDDREVCKELMEKLPEGCRLTCLIDSPHGAGAPMALPSMIFGDSSVISAAKRGAVAVSRGMQKLIAWSKRRGQPTQPAAEVLVITSRENPWSSWGLEGEECIIKKPFGSTKEGAIGLPNGALYIDSSRAAGGSNWGCGGALTSVFLEVLSRPEGDPLSLLALIDKINNVFIDRDYMQAPLIAASKTLDLRQHFKLDTWLC